MHQISRLIAGEISEAISEGNRDILLKIKLILTKLLNNK